MEDIKETPAVSPTETQAKEPTTVVDKDAPGASWRNTEQHDIPKNRIAIVFSGLMLSVFLAAIDQVRIS